jgi:arylsulfatase
VAFERIDRAARATLRIGDQDCGSIDIPRVMRMISSSGLNIGRNPGSAVSPDYAPPFAFEGGFDRLVFELPEKIDRSERQGDTLHASTTLGRQ